jgi:hypothetical protein
VSLVYQNGAGAGAYEAVDCPVPGCGQEVKVERRGDELRFSCRGGHSDEKLRPQLSARVMLELACANGRGPVPHSGNGAPVQHPPSREELWESCRELATDPRILGRVRELLPATGLVGEDQNALLVYLVATSRLLDYPVSVAVKGPSSGGKSWMVERVLQFFPESAYHALSAMSERALVYSEEPLAHRMLVIYEAAGMTGEFASYLMRSLLSEGRVRYETVESTSGGLKPKLIERKGPTGLIVTTTQVQLHPENETRLLSLTVTDTPDQTRDVMLALADEDASPDTDLTPWLALQEWLAAVDNAVAIPFGKALAKAIPPKAVRLRRDFRALLGLIRSHALLHQATRERDARDRVVATPEDYSVVRQLVEEVFSAGIGATVKAETRKTVQAVADLRVGHEDGVPLPVVANRLGLDKSVVSRRWRVARDGGYLLNLEERRGRPARLVLGEPLPEEVAILPSPNVLKGWCTVARAPERGTPRPSTSERLGGESPVRGASPCSCFRPGQPLSDGRCSRCYGRVPEGWSG